MPSVVEEWLAKIRDEHRRLGQLLEGCQGGTTQGSEGAPCDGQLAAIGACVGRMTLAVGAPPSPATTELRFRGAIGTDTHHYIGPEEWKRWAEVIEAALPGAAQ